VPRVLKRYVIMPRMLVNNKTQKRRKEEEERGEELAPLFRLAAKGNTPCKDEWGGSIPIARGCVNHPAVVVWPPPVREWFFVCFFFKKKKFTGICGMMT
jgi:hypothetical protein